ncbi:hypothetical protein [Reyranella sp.]|uniref:hypothetical protein n=1 Tax=Reyranella sp. TaxID=1929291 RepID=UPI001205D7BD|nr:hypothetical protein [Reyranella sp.]TAJ84660.1 MAG: hypothetical protein EPO50_18435 [Reyranella sp.]
MRRSLIAPLSPHEEVALRRIALGLTPTHELSARAIVRLKNLALIEDSEAGLRLTDVGRQRYRTLPGAMPAELPVAQEQLARALARYVEEAKN